MAAIYALLAALAFGTGDFLGGFTAQRIPALVVSLLSQIAGLMIFSVVVVVFALGNPPSSPALVWGTAAGVALGFGHLLYYRGLAVGQMGIVATDTAVWAALVPVAAGLLLGERPLLLADVGIVIIIIALSLVSRSSTDLASNQPAPKGISAWFVHQPGRVQGILAGISYGFFFIFLDQTGTGNPLWPQIAAVAGSVIVLGGAALIIRPPLQTGVTQWPLLTAIGVVQATGFLTFILATQTGLLSLVAVLAALSPVPTILLARAFLGQHLARIQVLGVITAIVGISLITLG